MKNYFGKKQLSKGLKVVIAFVAILAVLRCLSLWDTSEPVPAEFQRWSEDKANEWYAQQPWMSGCNFVPSNAINQLEMWQEETFSPELIDKELGWAEELGFNVMRVFLHSKAWEADKEGFKKRIDEYLTISMSHGIRTMFVIFDDCWNAEGAIGKQPEPKVGTHNSGWLKDPFISRRADKEQLFAELKPYVIDIMTTFKDDERVVMWDVYNEPNSDDSIPLLEKVFEWGREVNPSQPMTSSVWTFGIDKISSVQLKNSDVLSYHSYSGREVHSEWIKYFKMHNRPVVCTEYMARTIDNCTFQNVMPLMKEQNVVAINWGFVSGKTNTIYAWNTPIESGEEPEVWFHDILRQDKTPFSEDEIRVIKECNKR